MKSKAPRPAGRPQPGNRRAVRRWKKKHPRAARAHQLVFRALKAGTLTRLPCEKCGEVRSEAHHDSYGDPLNVRWLCRKHHREHHRRSRMIQPELGLEVKP